LVDEFPIGSVGPEEFEEQTPFIPKQASPEEDLKTKVKVTNEAGLRKITSVVDVMEDDEKLQMVIEDLLPDTGLMYIAGASGTGKTILAIQLVGNIVTGQPTLSWRLGPARTDEFKALFLSLEMPKKELQLRLQHMYPRLSDDERKAFIDRFLSYSEFEPFELWNPVHQLDLVKLIKAHNPNLVLIDSASVSFATSLKNDEQVNESIKYLYMIRARFNIAMVVVAHTRKPSIDMINNPENASINELFGHSGVAQSASAIIIMLEDEKQRKATIRAGEKGDAAKVEKMVHIVNAKSRFGTNAGAFMSYLTSKENVDKGEPLMFRRNAIPIAMTEEARRAINKSGELDMSKIMADFDIGLPEMNGDD
jgi:KaiC/GvpD/RAD55 family RecA-like ATPase